VCCSVSGHSLLQYVSNVICLRGNHTPYIYEVSTHRRGHSSLRYTIICRPYDICFQQVNSHNIYTYVYTYIYVYVYEATTRRRGHTFTRYKIICWQNDIWQHIEYPSIDITTSPTSIRWHNHAGLKLRMLSTSHWFPRTLICTEKIFLGVQLKYM